MKNFKKLLLGSALVISSVPALTGCGDSFSGITVNFWHSFGHGVTGAVETYAKEFAALVKENENVDVRIKMTYKGGYDDVLANVVKSFSTAGNPTLTVAYPDHVADYMYAEGNTPGKFVVNLEDYVDDAEIGFGQEAWLGDNHGKEDFVETYYEESTSYQRPGTYSIPFLKSTEVMIYNFKMVRTAVQKGYSELDKNASDAEIRSYMSNISWPDFMDFCENIKDHLSDINPKLLWPAYYDSDANLFISRLFQQGVTYSGIDAGGKGYIGFNGKETDSTPEQIANYATVQSILRQYKDWHDKGLFETKGVNGEYSSNQFKYDKCIFAMGSTGGSGYGLPQDESFELGVCKIPTWDGNPTYVTQGPTLAVLHNEKLAREGTDAEAVKYAWKFIKYITNDEKNAAICTTASEGYNPVRRSGFTCKRFTDYINAGGPYVQVTNCVINDIAEQYFHTAVFTGSAGLRTSMEEIFSDVMRISGFDKMNEEQKTSAIKTILDRGIDNAL